MTHAIETHNLTRRFGSVRALDGLEMQVPTGAVYAFLGPNGAGKTTTIHILMRLLEPSGGEARMLGTDCRRLGPRDLESIGYVSENQEIPGWMTVADLVGYCKPLYPAWDDGLCERLLAMLDLPRDRKIRHFSRGMKMKAALAVSLAYRPRLILLDEPFSGLDPIVRDQMIEALLEPDGERTVFVSSHDLEEVESLADHIGFLNHGKLIASEPIEKLLERHREVEVAVDRATPVEAAPSWRLVERGESLLRFIETDFQGEAAWRGRLPENAAATVAPATLRRIFATLAREGSQIKSGRARP